MSGSAPSPPFLSNQRGISDDAVVTRRSNTSRSTNQRSTSSAADLSTGTRSSSVRSSTFGSFFRTRIDSPSLNSAPTSPNPRPQQQQQQQQQQRPPQQSSQRPVSAYYPSQQPTMNRPNQSSRPSQQGSHRPNSTSFSAQQSMSPNVPRPQMQPNPSHSYSTIPTGLPAPLPNPYDPGYNAISYRPPQQSYPHHPPTSAPASYSHFQQPPPMSAPASYGSQFQSQQANYPYPTQINSPPIPPGRGQSDQQSSQADSDLEAVIRASEASAEEEVRKREQRQKEEEEHYLALHKSEEQERQRKQAEEEEKMLLEAMQASQLEEQELQRKRIEREREEEETAQRLLEESRQTALREEEERIEKQHAEVIERSKREAEEEEKKRNYELEQERLMEEAAMKESLRELEEEWKRREEAERADALHIQQGGQIGDASYWQNLDQKKAYDLALEMNERFAHNDDRAGPSNSHNLAPTSATASRRPLPPTPGMAALAAGVELPRKHVRNEQGEIVNQEQEWDLSEDELIEGEEEDEDDGQDPFSDQAEAPPMYDEVGGDRPPEAPTTIPSDIRFVRPNYGPQPVHNNTIQSLTYPSEKSAAYSHTSQSAPQSPDELNDQNGSSSHSGQDIESTAQPSSSSRPLPTPRSSSKVLPPPPSEIVPDQTLSPSTMDAGSSSQMTTDVSSSSQTHSTTPPQDTPTSETQQSIANSVEENNEFQQKAMKGTDFGYSSEPFGTELFLQTPSGEVDTDSAESKTKFPSVILLQKANVIGSLSDPFCFFIVRAPSWKALVRALAWYGNTRIEAGPEEVADHGNHIPLRIVIEFVTPAKASWMNPTVPNESAHVSVCFSLAVPVLKEESSKELVASLKNSSHALDSAYLRQGVTRRVIGLPSQAPKLPLDMVNIAQILHRAHTFSAACPSTGATALHSPRDLHHAVERHDIGYVKKIQKRMRENGLAGAGATAAISANNSASASNRRFSMQTKSNENPSSPNVPKVSPTGDVRRHSSILQPSNSANSSNNIGSSSNPQPDEQAGKLPEVAEDGLAEDDEENDGQGDILDAGAVEIVDGDDYGSGRMARFRAHVHRRLGKRSGDPRTVDQDLESWISE